MKRTLIGDLKNHTGEEVSISGFVDVRRDHGKLIFFDIRDRSGKVQAVVLPNRAEAQEKAKELRAEWTVSFKAKVNERPEKMVNKEEENGAIEIEVLEIDVLSRAVELPFEKDQEVNIDTYLDNLPLTLRSEKSRAIFKVQAEIVRSFREFLTKENFTEFQAPKLIGEDAEGGANSFALKYFKSTAHLAQSPQLYKQIMVGVFERVFSVGNVYRAEKHSTTRHLNEYTSLDIEMGFIKDHKDVMELETKLLKFISGSLKEKCSKEFRLLGAEVPDVPEEIPSMKLREAQDLIKKETGKDKTSEPDLEPEDERWLCEWAKKDKGSDFIFITHFPTSKRPFYTYEDKEDPGYTKGGDLLFRGVEITTLAQRIHDYNELVAALKKKELDSDKFSFYLQAFKYGMPPHGGFGMGLERLTQKFLNLSNVKEATLFPRDINRIDNLLSDPGR
ncbi:MAG: aspartate--tRNA(Asn) ligase [Parcubacteria group bacterium CG11_big_fil_rev_8_21_14_0_20_39_22]|nr:MAG: aspartate--tRNA(Asn) ligase [Parcubacteria group bacterium CG11_big_fil_rev_8_21_14_0_20_39_22]